MSDLLVPGARISQNPAQPTIEGQFPETKNPGNDPAWQQPKDPLGKNPKTRARVITREIPASSAQVGWSISDVRAAVVDLVEGRFDRPAQLVDALCGDSRFQSAMQSRVGGLLSKEVVHKLPAKYADSSEARECLDAWSEHWDNMATEPILADMQLWGSAMGFHIGQMLWDTSGKIWKPHIHTFNSRYTFYHWTLRTYVAITLDGLVPIVPGNSHWLMHAPYGMYRGWMRGSLRSVAPWWLGRNYGLRDWCRLSERHGMPIGKAITPFGADPDLVAQFRSDLSNLGQESIIQLPQSEDAAFGKYDLDWLETDGTGWQGFYGLITQCNSEITLAILGQNLTSEVKEGSFAAARVHADVKQSILEFDARCISNTMYRQVARPFAAVNFGNADFAPRTYWDITPHEDNKIAAETLSSLAQTVNTLRQAGYSVDDFTALCKLFGLHTKLAGINKIKADASPIRAYHLKSGIFTRDEVRKSVGYGPIGAFGDGNELIKETEEVAP